MSSDSGVRERIAPPGVGPRVRWRIVVALELVVVAAAVVFDIALPTLVILSVATLSLVARHERLSSLGLVSVPRAVRLATQVLGLVVLWTLVQIGLVMPVVEHLTGERQDVSQFEDLEGNLGLLAVLIVLSWTLAAFGEELAYRGFVHTRAVELFGTTSIALVVAVLVNASLFGLAHTEQGVVGVCLTFCDAVFFSVLRMRYHTLWAAVLAHGFNNTIGLVAFFLVGPIHGLW